MDKRSAHKAVGSGLGGAVVVLILAISGWHPTPEVVAAATTVVTAGLAYALPNQ